MCIYNIFIYIYIYVHTSARFSTPFASMSNVRKREAACILTNPLKSSSSVPQQYCLNPTGRCSLQG